MGFQALPYILLLGLLFGTTLVASRFSVGQFYPVIYISLRLLLAGSGHLLVYGTGLRRWPRGRQLWLRAGFFGVFASAVPLTFISSSLLYLSSGVASLVLTANPALTVLFAHFALADERLSLRKILGVALALGGASWLALRGESGLPDVTQANQIGYLLIFAAMVSVSLMMVYARKFMSDLDAFDVASVRMFSAAGLVVPLSALFVGFDFSRVDQQGVFAVLYASIVGTFFGMMLQFYIVKRFGATTSVLASYVIPIFASLGGVLVLGETITIGMMGSMVLIALGISLINRS